ncbi:MAG: hypothetical protein BZY75_04990 [SAR202 cluster bacterium Io17-Chloro-G7]|nr:MAG: hypothetical protein BZY75_04990 [SAR202 cluster bacterium Io17-Chloro-G7]
MTTSFDRSRQVEASDTIEAIEECYRMGWSDGLPVVPPVDYKVQEMLRYAGMTGEEELLSFEMRRRVLTSENAAANAVMAGCLPEYFPVLVTTMRALEEEKNYVSMAASSTSSPAILMIVNGPIRDQIGVNYKDGLFGPGFRANACLGRAIRLSFMNGFDAFPGTLDRGTLGNPSKYTLCIGENEEDSPWDALHVSRGFQPDDSCVTVAVAYNPITVNNAYGQTGESILASLADTLKSACLAWRFPAQWVVVIGPEHALSLQADGWTRRKIQDYLIENATRPLSELIRLGVAQGPEKPGDDKLIRRCSREPEDILIVMGGGTGGRNSAIIDTTHFKIRTRKVDMSTV